MAMIPNIPYYTKEDFTNMNPIASGGGGIIFSGKLKDFGQIAVKKFFFTQLPERYRKEIEILIKHKHPNIVQLYGILWDGSDKSILLGYVMEYVERGSLHKVIYDTTKSYDSLQMYLWIEQIARGIQFLHKYGIIHRDIKPGNILVAGDHLKLADFGEAKDVDRSTTAGVGSIHYMAPEALNSGECSHASDVYSLAITIWEIFHRKVPYFELRKANLFTLLTEIIGGVRPSIEPNKMDKEVEALVQKCWQATPSDRLPVKDIIDIFEMQAEALSGQMGSNTVTDINDSELQESMEAVTLTALHIPYYVMNDFQKLKKLDNGGYGTVFTGYDENGRTGKERAVAIKMFSTHDEYSEREIQILKTHTHEHIVQLFGVIWDEKDKDDPTKKPIYTGYVMEYMELGSLHKEIHDVSKQYDLKLIIVWIQQIGSGLQYLHEHEILHRDVKPRNILLATRTHLKLADFGLARNISHQNTYTSGHKGTDPYMAPEIVGTEKNYGAPADVYSFGVTIWEIICRKSDPDKMSEDSWNFVKRCWQRNISDRPSIKEIINFEPKFGPTILVVGGDSDNNKMTIWNRGTSTWTVSRMELPDHILSVGVAYLDDELYIIDWGKAFFKLDKNMELKRLADMNERRRFINNSCLGWNGYIWVFGGWYMDREEELKSVERYDRKEDKWTEMPDMKYGRYHAAAAVCNGKIYICGGIGDVPVGLKSVECFDLKSEVWTELADMPTPRYGHSLVCYRNKLVVIGGWDGRGGSTTVLELDPLKKNGQWKELSPLTSPSFDSVGVVLGREIFAISSDKVQIFNGINWHVGPSFPLNYYRPPSAVLVPHEIADRLSSYPVD